MPIRSTVLAALVLASLLLSHEIVYLLAHGIGEGSARVMSESGHDQYWTTFVLTTVSVTAVLVAVTVRQLRRLSRLAQRRLVIVDGGWLRLAALTARAWAVIGVLTLLAFLVQENAERGFSIALLDVVAGEHALATPVVALVTLLVGFVAALAAWRRERLMTAIGPHPRPRPNRQARSAYADIAVAAAVTGPGAHGRRAPPSRSPATT